jgi:hypothetical protein
MAMEVSIVHYDITITTFEDILQMQQSPGSLISICDNMTILLFYQNGMISVNLMKMIAE